MINPIVDVIIFISGIMGFIGFLWWLWDRFLSPRRKRAATKEEVLELKEQLNKIRGNQDILLDGLLDRGPDIKNLLKQALLAEKEYRHRDAINFWKQIEIQRDIGDSGLCAVYLQLASLYRYVGEGKYYDAEYYINKAYKVAEKIGGIERKELLISVFNVFGIIKYVKAEIEDAKDYYEKSIKQAGELEDNKSKAISLSNLGNLYREVSDIKKGRECLDEALRLDELNNNKKGQVADLTNLGNLYSEIGDLSQAEEYYRKALSMAKDINDEYGIAYNSGNLGTINAKKGDIPEAERLYSVALEYHNRMGDLIGIGNSYGNLGIIYQQIGDNPKAEMCLQKALEVFRSLNNVTGIASQLINLGILYFHVNNLEEAEKCLKESYDENKKIGRLNGVANALIHLSNIYLTKCLYDEAEQNYLEALGIYEEIGNIHGKADVYTNLALLKREKELYELAIEYSEKALNIYEQLGNPLGYAANLLNKGNTYASMGDFLEARKSHKGAASYFKKYGLIEEYYKALVNLVLDYYYSGDVKRALEIGNKAINEAIKKQYHGDNVEKLRLFIEEIKGKTPIGPEVRDNG